MSGMGEKYSFWDMGLYGTDLLRAEFGSYWGYDLMSVGEKVVSIPHEKYLELAICLLARHINPP